MKFDIWKECPKVPLPSVLLTVVDNRGKTVPTAPSGHKLIATNCVRNENLYPVYEKIRYLSEETYRTWFRAHPEPGDIIFVCKGTPGRVCLVPDPIDFCIAQDMVALRANPKIVYNKYLLAVLRSFQIQEQILSTSVGDVIPHFKKSFFDQIMIPIPNMDIQKSIGDFYYTISEKTELNKKINDNFPYNFQDRLQPLPFGGTKVQFYTPSLEDLVIAKLCSFCDTDKADVESEAVRNSLDWDLLEHLATDEDELRASILNDWRYRDFYIRYQEYVERWRPCES